MEVQQTLVWLRRDLRVTDNPALYMAAARGGPVIPVYVWAPEDEGDWSPGSAAKWWLERSLAAFDCSLRNLDSRLVLRRGQTAKTLCSLAKETGATSVFWQMGCEPNSLELERQVQTALTENGIATETFDSSGLFDIGGIAKDDGSPYKVFAAYWRKLQSLGNPIPPLQPPGCIRPPDLWPTSLTLEDLGLSKKEQARPLFSAKWEPGEKGALQTLTKFLDDGLKFYSYQRDRPDLSGTSLLSAHLNFGEISARMLWEIVSDHDRTSEISGKFLTELGWREFARHVLYHFPDTTTEPMRREFSRFPWRSDLTDLEAWQFGRTGYPFVDAGMRQLLSVGWIHNRVRMVVASFLIKDLMLPWQEGSRWFWEKLVDADLASNTMGWQWVAGSGASSAPYFRIFNPVTQGEKFDPKGAYVRRWVPELSGLPDVWVHKPWLAPRKTLEHAGLRLGTDYPEPIVDHASSRLAALSGFQTIKKDLNSEDESTRDIASG